MRIVIDGYNVVASLPSLRVHFPGNLEKARDEFRELLVLFKKNRGHRITVVYDGQGGQWGGSKSMKVSGISEIYTSGTENADQVIIRKARSKPDGLVVVTKDREVESACSKAGAAVLSPAEFESVLMDAVLNIDKGSRDDDYAVRDDRKGTRKKGPSKKPKKRDRVKNRRKAKL